MKIVFEPFWQNQAKTEFEQVEISFRSKNQSILIMIVRVYNRFDEDFACHVDYASVIWSSDYLWRRPWYKIKNLYRKYLTKSLS